MAKVICDIDGTLSDYAHRIAHLEVEDYDAFQSLANLDAPIFQIIHLVDCLRSSGHDIHLWTGRNERYRTSTMEWLINQSIRHQELRMRPDDDFQSDFVLKEQWLNELGEQPLLAIDDRTSVVAMFRRRGVICLQPCEGRY